MTTVNRARLISEVIADLEKLRDEHGDRFLFVSVHGAWVNITEIKTEEIPVHGTPYTSVLACIETERI